MIAPALMTWMILCCSAYGVEPEFALAVWKVESGNAQHEFRIGRLGRSKYWGPAGLNEQCFPKHERWRVAEPREHIRIAVAALRGRDKMSILKRYNREITTAYTAAVMANYRRYKRERTCRY